MLYASPRRKTRRKIVFPNAHLIQKPKIALNTKRAEADPEFPAIRNNPSPPTSFIDRMRTKPLPAWIGASPIQEDFETESSMLQQDTADECVPLLTAFLPVSNEYGLPSLARQKHIRFLRRGIGRLPPQVSSLDASKPWILYWCLNGLALLGEDMEASRKSLIKTLRPIQNSSGGFGGGQGQYSHLATTYSAVLSLIIVGGEEAYELIDREAMWHWLGSLKQPEGDFEICQRGERDARAAYCAMVMISLLDLPLELPPTSPARAAGHETFTSGLAEWISRCQTFEGGLGDRPGTEAHGAYVFCALACLCILGEPAVMMEKYLDLPALVKWLTARQHAPEGGLAGRTNKLVDGCYSHWIGGCYSLIEAAVDGLTPRDSTTIDSGPSDHDAQSSDTVISPPKLWNRDALIRYILCCCQADIGGLRDKPSKNPDAYHTNYNLVGLSSAQNHFHFQNKSETDTETRKTNNDDTNNRNGSKSLSAAFGWTSSATPFSADSASEPQGQQIFNEKDRVMPIHPVYVIPAGKAEAAHAYFAKRPLDVAALGGKHSRTGAGNNFSMPERTRPTGPLST